MTPSHLIFATTLAFLTLGAALNASAQDLASSSAKKDEHKKIINQYDPIYKIAPSSKVVTIQDDNKKPTIGYINTDAIPVQDYGIYFIREPGTQPNEARLRISLPVSVVGCVSATPPKLRVIEEPPYLRATITPPVIKPNRTKNPGRKTCQNLANNLYVDLVLNRDAIKEHGIEKLSLRDGSTYDTFNIYLDEEKILLTGSSETFKPQKRPNKPNPLEYWFYPENTVILSARNTGDYDETQLFPEIKKLANEQNLITMNAVMTEFEQDEDDKNRYYFVDETGVLPKKIGDANNIAIGQIKLKQDYTGLGGDYNVTNSYEIYARKPGYYD